MTFPRVRAPGLWVLGSVVAPAEMEEIDQNLSDAVDGADGGAYAPTSRITLGGSGWDFTGGTGADPLGPLTSTAAPGTGAAGGIFTGDGSGRGMVGVSPLGLGGQCAGGIGGFWGIGASGDAYGVAGLGHNGGNGISGLGGSNSGAGGFFTGGGPNGFGVDVGAPGTRPALRATAGSGLAGLFLGATGQFAIEVDGGVPNGAGAVITAHGTGTGLRVVTDPGAVLCAAFVGAPVNVDQEVASTAADPLRNVLWGTGIVRALCFTTTDGLGSSSDVWGQNYTATINAGDHTKLDVAFTRHMANAAYHLAVTVIGPTTGAFLERIVTKTASGFTLQALEVPKGAGSAASYLDFAATATNVSFSVFGESA